MSGDPFKGELSHPATIVEPKRKKKGPSSFLPGTQPMTSHEPCISCNPYNLLSSLLKCSYCHIGICMWLAMLGDPKLKSSHNTEKMYFCWTNIWWCISGQHMYTLAYIYLKSMHILPRWFISNLALKIIHLYKHICTYK